MVHKLIKNRSDWANTPSSSWNKWQRLAAKTRGFVTPGNVVTLTGLVLSLVGLAKIYNGSLLLGSLLLGFGRLADILDGYAAGITGTKSRVGEALDAITDKIVIGFGLIVFLYSEIMPLLPLVIILLLNIVSAAFSIIARIKGRELHPSKAGKWATINQWLILLIFIGAQLVSSHSIFLADVLNTIGYIYLLLFLPNAIDAVIGYYRHAFGRSSTKAYSYSDGGLNRKMVQLFQLYWHKKWLVILSGIVAFILLFTVYSLAASPYSSDSFVQVPFTTSYQDGQVVLTQHFTPTIYHGWFFSTIGYCAQAVSVVWDRLRSPQEPAGSLDSIIANIHAQRFDPSKPYVISGDQFDGLYLRNLSVFYQDLLNPYTSLNTTDWQNRQRIAVQSLAYGLSATQQLKYPVTTLLPITGRGVIAVNFWSYPSDTMFSLFQQLQTMENNLSTRHVALQLQHEYSSGLLAAYQNYLQTVRDPATGLIRTSIRLSSARDAVQRQSSFYDNVILWRTEQLATQLGFANVSDNSLASLRQTILSRYWNNTFGHFKDDAAPGNENSYSSDWLIALPVGFLNPTNPNDRLMFERISAYIDKTGLTKPLPIRYTANASTAHQDFFVRYFAGSYGNTAIWSYWGDQYIALEEALYQQTGTVLYAHHVESSLSAWRQVIVRDRGYPETIDSHGNILKTIVYESIRRNGWVVDFESEVYNWNQITKGSQP